MKRRPADKHRFGKVQPAMARRDQRSRKRTRHILGNEPLETRCVLSTLSGETPPFEPPPDLPFPPEESSQEFGGGGDEGGFGAFAFVTLGIAGADPSDGSTHSGALAGVSVLFDRPIDPGSIGIGDILLERVNEQGEVDFVLDPFADVLEQTLDVTGTRLTAVFSPGLVLEAGTYRVVLSETSFLMGTDFSFLPNLGMRETVATFQLETAQGKTLADAIDLGIVGPRVRRVDGLLDFVADPKAVDLYRFDLSEGHFWRLGIEAMAQRIGSQLDAAIALFDAEGNRLATADLGLATAPNDPYLFRGLPAGTYFIGVSGTGNLPGEPGGYDPAAGTPELRTVDRTSGPYRLRLVADAADAPSRLTKFELVRADKNDTAPTGFSLKFSDAVVPSSFLEPGVALVDEAGVVWPLQLDTAPSAAGRINYFFASRLPDGQYTLRVDAAAPLHDLAGYIPLGRRQEPDVLARFEVRSQKRAVEATDLGAMYPEMIARSRSDAVSLQAGESITYRMVVLSTYQAGATFETRGGSVEVEVFNTRTGTRAKIVIESDSTVRTPLLFEAGEVFLRVKTTSSQASTLYWGVDRGHALSERVETGTLGSNSALGLRLVQSEAGDAMTSQSALSDFGSGGAGSAGPGVVPGGANTPTPGVSGGTGQVDTSQPSLPGISTGNAGGLLAGTTPSVQGANSAPTSGHAALSLNVISAEVGGSLVGRAADTGEGSSALAFVAEGSGVGVVGVATTLLPSTHPSERSRLAHNEEIEGGESEIPATETPEIEAQPGEGADGALDADALSALVDAARPEMMSAALGGGNWLDAALSRLGSLFSGEGGSATEPVVDTQVASMDPFTRLLPGADELARNRPSWVDPMAVIVAAAVMIEGRRCLTRWLGKRHGMQLLGGRRVFAKP